MQDKNKLVPLTVCVKNKEVIRVQGYRKVVGLFLQHERIMTVFLVDPYDLIETVLEFSFIKDGGVSGSKEYLGTLSFTFSDDFVHVFYGVLDSSKE